MKNFINDIGDSEKNVKKKSTNTYEDDEEEYVKTGVKQEINWMFWKPVIVSIIIAATVLSAIYIVTSALVKVKSNEFETDIPVTPIVQEVVQDKLETTSNTVTEGTVYIEYLEETSEEIVTEQEGKITWAGARFNIPDGYTLKSEGLYVSEDESIFFTTSKVFDKQFDYISSRNKDFLNEYGTGAYEVPVVNIEEIVQESIRAKGIVVWFSQGIVANTEIYQTVIETAEGYVSIVNNYAYNKDLATEIVDRLKKSTSTTVYTVNGENTSNVSEVFGYDIILPETAGEFRQTDTLAMINTGKALSDNILYVFNLPITETSLTAKISIGTAVSLDSGSAPEDIKVNTEIAATWLKRPATYIEYRMGDKRICAYRFDKEVEQKSTFFVVAERDNKFPYMLRYLNTLAYELK